MNETNGGDGVSSEAAAGGSALPAVVDLAGHTASDDAALIVEALFEFFDDFMPRVAIFLLLFFGSIVLVLLVSSACRFQLRRCRAPPHYVNLFVYILMLATLALGFAVALSAAGMNVHYLLLSVGALSILFSYGCARTIGEIGAGIELQFDPVVEDETIVEIPSAGIVGRIHSMNLLRVELDPQIVKDGAEVFETGARKIHVPNSVMRTQLVIYRNLADNTRHADEAAAAAATVTPSFAAAPQRIRGGDSPYAVAREKRRVDAWDSTATASIVTVSDEHFLATSRATARHRFMAAQPNVDV